MIPSDYRNRQMPPTSQIPRQQNSRIQSRAVADESSCCGCLWDTICQIASWVADFFRALFSRCRGDSQPTRNADRPAETIQQNSVPTQRNEEFEQPKARALAMVRRHFTSDLVPDLLQKDKVVVIAFATLGVSSRAYLGSYDLNQAGSFGSCRDQIIQHISQGFDRARQRQPANIPNWNLQTYAFYISNEPSEGLFLYKSKTAENAAAAELPLNQENLRRIYQEHDCLLSDQIENALKTTFADSIKARAVSIPARD